MEDLVEHSVDFSAPQLTKLRKGLNITIQPKHFNSNGKHLLNIMGNTHSRIMSAFKKGKGLKICLKGRECIMKKGEGIGKAFKKVGKAFKDTYASPQAIQTYRQIGKQASKYGLDYALPAVMGGVGEMLGGPAGSMVGSMGADIIADQVHNRTGYGIANRVRARPINEGQGLYKALSKVGIKKRAVINTVKTVGKNALKLGSETVKAGLQAYGVPPSITDPMINKLERIGEKAIDRGNIKGLKEAGRDVKSLGQSSIKNIKQEALQYFDDEIDALPEEYRQIANDALDTVQTMRNLSGEGVYNSSIYKKTMRLKRGGAIPLGIAEGYVNLSSLAPSDSPSMNPFIPNNNPYQGYNPIKSGGRMRYGGGGSFIPAGTGFLPAGYHSY